MTASPDSTAAHTLPTEEHFAWLKAHGLSDSGVLKLEAGPGYLTMRPSAGSAGTVKAFEHDFPGGALLSATCVAQLTCGKERRFVVLQRDLDAPVSPGCWQIPAGRCAPGESPLLTAVRELEEEVGIEGTPEGWQAGRVLSGERPVQYRMPSGVLEFEGQWAWHHATYEFYVQLELEVPSFEAIRLWDREPYGRPVRLVTRKELVALLDARKLAAGSEAVVRRMLACGQLAREMLLTCQHPQPRW